MHKIIIFFLGLLILTSCGQSQSDIDAAKQQILNPQSGEPSTELDALDKASVQDVSTEQLSEESTRLVTITPLDANSPLVFDRINEQDLSSGEVIISGKNIGEVEKIEVVFSNTTSGFPSDTYTLQTFNPGDETFKYIASSKNQVLDFGRNEYIFRAYSGEAQNETRVVLQVPNISSNESQDPSVGEAQGEISFDTLPSSSNYGEAIRLGEDSFTYSQIKGLEITKASVANASCEGLTDYLRERISTWFFWNTCRDLIAEKGISYNVIRLEDETYIYERHYVDFVNGLYGTYELERGEGVTPENISDKNTQLRSETFENIDIVDGLIRDIINS